MCLPLRTDGIEHTLPSPSLNTFSSSLVAIAKIRYISALELYPFWQFSKLLEKNMAHKGNRAGCKARLLSTGLHRLLTALLGNKRPIRINLVIPLPKLAEAGKFKHNQPCLSPSPHFPVLHFMVLNVGVFLAHIKNHRNCSQGNSAL